MQGGESRGTSGVGSKATLSDPQKLEAGRWSLVQLLDKASILYIVIHIQDRRG